jgi:hypothetical protein
MLRLGDAFYSVGLMLALSLPAWAGGEALVVSPDVFCGNAILNQGARSVPQVIDIKVLSPEIPAQLAREFRGRILELNRRAFRRLRLPPRIELRLAHSSNMLARTRNGQSRIDLDPGLRLRGLDPDGSLTLSVLDHEVGHLLPRENLEFLRAIYAEYEHLKANGPREALGIVADRLKQDIDLLHPYLEILGDVVSVGMSGDPVIVRRARSLMIEINNSDPKNPYVPVITNLFRDFSRPPSAVDWRRTEMHEVFMPTRYFIWKHYLSPEAGWDVGDFLPVMLRAIEVELLYRRGEGRGNQFSSRELNLRLMDAIQAASQAEGARP